MKKCCFNRNSPMVVVALTVQAPTPLTVLLHEWVHAAVCLAFLNLLPRKRKFT